MRDTLRAWYLGVLAGAFAATMPAQVCAQTAQAPDTPHPDTYRLVTRDDLAGVVVNAPDGSVRHVYVIATLGAAISILSDQRLSPVWPALLDWAGQDLGILRKRVLIRAAGALVTNGQYVPTNQREAQGNWPKQLLAFQKYLDALSDAGRADEAIEVARAEIAAPAMHEEAIDIGQIQTKLASLLERAGHVDQAIAMLRKAAADTKDQGTRENIVVNLAAKLARTGKFEEALALDNAIEAGFDGYNPSKVKTNVGSLPDSHDYFTAIRACALDGLGRHADAAATLAQITPEPDVPYSSSVRSQTRVLAYLFMNDAAGLAAEWASLVSNAEPGTSLFGTMQPGMRLYPAERATVIKALAMPVLVQAMAGRVRILGEPYASAIAWWVKADPAPARETILR